jgi:bacterioferritin-associated ferredoxin
MYVCVCRAVTDREVEGAIEGGADTLEKVVAACGAGGGCGACHNAIEDMIESRDGCVRLCVVRERAA